MEETTKYYYRDKKGQPIGPFTEQEMKDLSLHPNTFVWCKGLNRWYVYSDVFPNHNNVVRDKKKKIIFAVSILGLMVIVIIILFCLGHSTHAKLESNSHDSDEFNMYLEKYYRDLEFFGISIVKPRKTIIRFASMQYFDETKDYYGLCYGIDDDSKIEIYINEDAWQRLSRTQKYYVMYHELSHDLMNVKDSENGKKSLMSPYMDINQHLTMDDFIELSHSFFIEQSRKH